MRPVVEAGKFRHLIQIVQPNSGLDSMGGTLPGGTPISTERCSIEAITGKEIFAAQEVIAQVSHKITLRYKPYIKANLLVWWTQPDSSIREFQIQHVQDPDGVHWVQYLFCLERNDSQRQTAS